MRRRVAEGHVTFDLQSADVPAVRSVSLLYECHGSYCELRVMRPDDTYFLVLRSGSGTALCDVMNQLIDYAFSPPH